MEIIKDFESRAMQSGSEVRLRHVYSELIYLVPIYLNPQDPDVSSTLQKCEEYIPGEVDVKVVLYFVIHLLVNTPRKPYIP